MDDMLRASRLDRLEDLVLTLNNENGALTVGERVELQAEMRELKALIGGDKVSAESVENANEMWLLQNDYDHVFGSQKSS